MRHVIFKLLYISELNANIIATLPSPTLCPHSQCVCVCMYVCSGFHEIILNVCYDPSITFPILDTFEFFFLLSNEKKS